jgi:hypothetical protein
VDRKIVWDAADDRPCTWLAVGVRPSGADGGAACRGVGREQGLDQWRDGDVRARLVDRLHVRGERADRFRLRPEAWDEQLRDQPATDEARAVLAQGLEALAGEPRGRRARLEELDSFYAWWQSRSEGLWDEWQQYKRTKLGELDDD